MRDQIKDREYFIEENLYRNTCLAGTGKTPDVTKRIRAARRYIMGIGALKPGLWQKY